MYRNNTPTSCMVSLLGDDEHHSFLVGTYKRKSLNELKLFRYDEDNERVTCIAVYDHTHEISQLSASPITRSYISTVYSTVANSRGSLWKLTDLEEIDRDYDSRPSASITEPAKKQLTLIAELPTYTMSNLRAIEWNPDENQADTVIAVYDNGLHYFRIKENGLTAINEIPMNPARNIGGISWDPHHPNLVAVAADSSVYIFDLRSESIAYTVPNAVTDGGFVRSISYNPNKPWVIATSGDDHSVRIWDFRKPTVPLKRLHGHIHSVNAVAFNPFHDQMILSGGADARVSLWRAATVSSAPLIELCDNEDYDPTNITSIGDSDVKGSSRLTPDVAIKVNDNHSDSITSIAWSSCTAWVYASLSYDGELNISQVPATEKYKILL